MAATTRATMAPSKASGACCSNCGHAVDSAAMAMDAEAVIADLQAQILLLSRKATSAADKAADYEDELRHLRTLVSSAPADPAWTPSADGGAAAGGGGAYDGRAASPSPPEQQQRPQRPNYVPIPERLSSFLTTRKPVINMQTPPTPSTPSHPDLLAALSREQSLRQAAEGKLDEASGELEELSAQLFTQANEMVAVERKARAQLEERVVVLERRDVEKRARLERLEGALRRIERVRGLLAPGK